MDNPWYQIPMAIVLIFLMWRIWPIAIHQLKHGPRGSSKQWLNVSVILAAVVLFVTFLIIVVRG